MIPFERAEDAGGSLGSGAVAGEGAEEHWHRRRHRSLGLTRGGADLIGDLADGVRVDVLRKLIEER